MEFVALSIRVFNFQRNRLEKRIIEKCDMLSKDIWLIVLEYSYIGDNWTKPGYFDNLFVDVGYADGHDFKISHDTNTSPNIGMVIKLRQSTSTPPLPDLFVNSPIFEWYNWILKYDHNIHLFVNLPDGVSTEDQSAIGRAFKAFIVNTLIWS